MDFPYSIEKKQSLKSVSHTDFITGQLRYVYASNHLTDDFVQDCHTWVSYGSKTRHCKWRLTVMSYNPLSYLFPHGNCFNHLKATVFPTSLLFTDISKHLSYHRFSVWGLLKCSHINNTICLCCTTFHTKCMKNKVTVSGSLLHCRKQLILLFRRNQVSEMRAAFVSRCYGQR